MRYSYSVLNAQQCFAFLCYSWNRVYRVPRFCCFKDLIRAIDAMHIFIFINSKLRNVKVALVCNLFLPGPFFLLELPQYAQIFCLDLSAWTYLQLPLRQRGCRQCLPLSVVQLKDKHCQKPHCHNGVVDALGQYQLSKWQKTLLLYHVLANIVYT